MPAFNGIAHHLFLHHQDLVRKLVDCLSSDRGLEQREFYQVDVEEDEEAPHERIERL